MRITNCRLVPRDKLYLDRVHSWADANPGRDWETIDCTRASYHFTCIVRFIVHRSLYFSFLRFVKSGFRHNGTDIMVQSTRSWYVFLPKPPRVRINLTRKQQPILAILGAPK